MVHIFILNDLVCYIRFLVALMCIIFKGFFGEFRIDKVLWWYCVYVKSHLIDRDNKMGNFLV
jgi:hypothetical protein